MNPLKIYQQLIKSLPIGDKQFIAHRKNYTTRLLREEIRRQAMFGQERFLIPTPRTLALIEGYISIDDVNDAITAFTKLAAENGMIPFQPGV